MSKEKALAESDVRAMVRLLGEVAANEGDHAAKKRQLMEGVCRLIDADCWGWSLCASIIAGSLPSYLVSYHGGWSEEQFAHFMRAMNHPDMIAITAPLAVELAQKGAHLTRLSQQVDPQGNISTMPVGEHWRAAGVGPIVLSFRPLDERSYTAIAFYRKAGRPFFDERASRIAHILLSEVPWLHAQGWPQDRGVSIPSLSPRQRTVLNLLVRGMSRKRIAAHLSLSVHTANDHVKAVFRHFHVNSQSELVSRMLSGDGGDQP